MTQDLLGFAPLHRRISVAGQWGGGPSPKLLLGGRAV